MFRHPFRLLLIKRPLQHISRNPIIITPPNLTTCFSSHPITPPISKMSSDFLDELEAINAIYSSTTLIPAPTPPSYLLTLPATGTILRLNFPPSYPTTTPPEILSLESAGDLTKRGSGARDLQLFTEALSLVWEPGVVCIFDAIEETARTLENLAATEEAAEKAVEADAQATERAAREPPSISYILKEPPVWTISDPFTESKSTFIAHVTRVTSPDQAAACISHLLVTEKKLRGASHNITAWRIRGNTPGLAFQDSDDDGESAAGTRLLHLMQLANVWDVVVVVSRFFGGSKIGPKRFALINKAAGDALMKGGWMEDRAKENKKKK